MRKQDLKFEQLTDVIGFRIIVGTIDDCYMMLGIVHQNWPSIPGRFKDYILYAKKEWLSVYSYHNYDVWA